MPTLFTSIRLSLRHRLPLGHPHQGGPQNPVVELVALLHLADDLPLLVLCALLGSSGHLKCQTHRLKLCCLLTLQLRADMLESPDSFLRIQSLSATKANLGRYCQDGSMNSAP